MTGDQIRQIFDHALELTPGECIRIPCDSRPEQDSIRSQLYKERSAYLKRAVGTAKTIGISRSTISATALGIKGKWFVIIRSVPVFLKYSVVASDGTERTITVGAQAVPGEELPEGTTDEQARIVHLMIEDGATREEALAFITQEEQP